MSGGQGGILESIKVSRNAAKQIRAQGCISPEMAKVMREGERNAISFEDAMAHWKQSVKAYSESRKASRSTMDELRKAMGKSTGEMHKTMDGAASGLGF